MKKNLLRTFIASASIMLLSLISFAQESRPASSVGSLYVISADAGGVNYVEGNVAVKQNNGRNGFLLRGDRLNIGEKVVTGTDGKAEILLNPGSYLRLAENSGFEFLTTSLEDLQLKLTRGSAMFEVITSNDFTFAVNTPKGRFYILESGVYRIDVLADGSGKIEVWKGKAQTGDIDAQIVKGGRTATINGNQVKIEKFDRDDKDALEAWSKTRAKELAKVNSRLQRNTMRDTLVNSYRTRGWNMYDSYGLWVFDRFSGNYCFLPFGYGWNSPYGYGYGRDLWYLRLPRYIYYQPPVNTNNPPAATGRALRPDNGVTPRVRALGSNDGNSVRTLPPYLKVQRDVGLTPIQTQQQSNDSIFSDSRGFPSSFPSQRSEPIQISPANSSGRVKGGN